MTPERKEENKLKKGDRVVMHTCIEAETHNGRIWTCSGDQFTRGTGALAQDSVFLEGFSGSFAPEFLQKVMLPTEDERLLAALEEAERQLQRTKITSSVHEGNSDAYFAECERLRGELEEAQQTIVRKQLYIEKLELSRENAQQAADDIAKEKGSELFEARQTIALQREALNIAMSQNQSPEVYQKVKRLVGEGAKES